MRTRLLGIALFLLLCLLTGCTGKTQNEQNTAANREADAVSYQEEAIELPFSASDESIIGMTKNLSSEIQIYTWDEASKGCNVYTIQEDNTFQKEAFSAADAFMSEATAPWTVTQGMDGSVYFLYFGSGYTPHIVRVKDGDTQELAGSQIEKQLSDGSMNYPAAILGTEDGGFLIAYMGTQAQYFDADGNLNYELQIGSGDVNVRTDIALCGTSFLAPNMDGSKLVVYDLESGKEKNQINKSSGQDFMLLRPGSQQDFYMLDGQGLHHMTEEGKIWETCIDSADMLALLENAYPNAFEMGSNNDCYILYRSNGKYSLKYYSRPDNSEATSQSSEISLKIVGMRESNTMKRAISEFEKTYPGVSVDFQSYEEVKNRGTLSETVRIINTDILSGENGADLIVLDGLPEDSYIDKGALADLTEFTDGLQGDDALLENLLKGKNGEIYSLPARFSVPILYGTDYAMDQFESLETILSFLENPEDTPLVSYTSYQLLAECLLVINYEEIAANLPDTAVIKNYMDAVKGLGDYTDAIQEELEVDEEEAVQYLLYMGTPSCLGKDKAAIREIKNITDLAEPIAFQKEYGQSIRLAGGLYIPYDSVGISVTSQHMEEAQNFLKILLSYSIQSLGIGEGFPVNEKAFQELTAGSYDSEIGAGWEEDGQKINMTFSNPDEQDVESFKEMVLKAEKPLHIDSNVRELLLEGAKRVYSGEADSESAAADVAQKLKLYMAED